MLFARVLKLPKLERELDRTNREFAGRLRDAMQANASRDEYQSLLQAANSEEGWFREETRALHTIDLLGRANKRWVSPLPIQRARRSGQRTATLGAGRTLLTERGVHKLREDLRTDLRSIRRPGRVPVRRFVIRYLDHIGAIRVHLMRPI